MIRGRIAELAEEATDCIETTGLQGKELEGYLRGFLEEVVDEALGKKVKRAPKR